MYTLNIAPANTSATQSGAQPASVPDAFCVPQVFPTGLPSVSRTLVPPFQVPFLHQKSPSTEVDGLFGQGHKDLNSRFLEYMVFLKLSFTQNARFVSNIPIFPTDIFTIILLRVLVRVKNKGNFSKSAKHPSRGEPFGCFALGVYMGK